MLSHWAKRLVPRSLLSNSEIASPHPVPSREDSRGAKPLGADRVRNCMRALREEAFRRLAVSGGGR